MTALAGVLKMLLASQAADAAVAGSVRDAVSGEPVAGVVVALTDLDRSTVTDSLGRYHLAGVPAGPQHVLARRIGYTPRALHALVPRHGTLEIHVTLQPHAVTLAPAPVAARAGPPVQGLEDHDSTRLPDRGLSIEAVRQHPLLAEPDVLHALAGGDVVLDPESPRGLHVRGGSSDQVAYLLDGIPVFHAFHALGSFSGWNPDALARVQLSDAAPGAGAADVLSGVVAAETRAPGSTVRMQGGTSSTQARLTVDGPLGTSGAGYLVSLRSGFPGFPGSKHEPSYLRGETGDWLGTLSARLVGGQLRLLGYGSTSEMDAAAAAPAESPGAAAPARHAFEWTSRSFGAAWSRAFGRLTLRTRAWHALGNASGLWSADSGPQPLAARRTETAALAALDLEGDGASTTIGLRASRGRTDYRGGALALSARTPVTAAFARHARWNRTARLELELLGARAAQAWHASPRAAVHWQPLPAITLSASAARLVQFGQSLRNPEAAAGSIFPVDLYAGAGASLPVATSDQAGIALEYRPAAGLRMTAQAYTRTFDHLVLVAPGTSDPFATESFEIGAGAAQGLALSLSAGGARYGAVASYGLQRVRRSFGDSSYTPDHGATHTLDAGIMVHPSPTFSLRLGASGRLGRYGTALTGPFEWEACSLGDQGCEFAGTPGRDGALGAAALPAYFRVDLGLRKHWHLRLAGRDGLVALYGTVTNLFGRRNVLTVATQDTGERAPIEMRPLGPLVVGLDWRF